MTAVWLIGGYALIVLSYVWVWGIAAVMSRHMTGERTDRLTKADAKAVTGMMAAWTVAWSALAIIDALR